MALKTEGRIQSVTVIKFISKRIYQHTFFPPVWVEKHHIFDKI